MYSSVKSKKSGALPPKISTFFRKNLLEWYEKNTRPFPWVGIKDPYRVWLSEIILQQTRVEQGLPYYEKILGSFPTVHDLAAADDQRVFRLWQGLGYYNRCKNMLAAARLICEKNNGIFPDTYEEILALPGVGAYTAAAVASFAFDLPHAVVDGNVERLLARFLGVEIAVNTTQGKKIFTGIAAQLLDMQHPARYNQAIMDFGATVCLPRQPLCVQCPFRPKCVAYNKGLIEKLPLKKPKKAVKNRYLHYIVFRHKDQLFIRKRPDGDIWQNLHEFLLLEYNSAVSEEKLKMTADFKKAVEDNMILEESYSSLYIHQLTHQKLHIRFWQVVLKQQPRLPEAFSPVEIAKTDHFAFPRPLVKYLATLRHF